MRREYKENKDDYLDWLKSLGCVLYLPMSEEGDLQDRISGISLVATGDGSYYWDANRNAYVITTPSITARAALFLNSDFNKNLFPDNVYTSLSTTMAITRQSGRFLCDMCPIAGNGETSEPIRGLYNSSGNTGNWPAGFVKSARINTPNERKYYQNGTLFGTYGGYAAYNPRNWNTDGDGIYIGYSQNETYCNNVFLTKELYVFNTVLDLQTIRKIQGYE